MNLLIYNMEIFQNEIDFIKNKLNKNLFQHKNIDLFEDIDSLASIIKSCDVVITSSNSTAHLAGALGVNTFLLIPKSRGKLWYWTAVEGKSYWYKSIKIFKQIKPNSWIEPLHDIANQLKKI
jgi:Spore coat polysaccharide biosynthesis protein, predicted glycosyltransferase